MRVPESCRRRPVAGRWHGDGELLWNERQQVDQAFAAMAAATEACIGKEFADPDMGDVVITSFDAPAIGTSSFTSGYRPVTPPTSDPWLEIQGISSLMSDPSSPVSVVITVSQTVVHNNPDQQVAGVDTDELINGHCVLSVTAVSADSDQLRS